MLLLQTFNKTPHHVGAIREGKSKENLTGVLSVCSPQSSAKAGRNKHSGFQEPLLYSTPQPCTDSSASCNCDSLSYELSSLCLASTGCPPRQCLKEWLQMAPFLIPVSLIQSTTNQFFHSARERPSLSIFLLLKNQELVMDSIWSKSMVWSREGGIRYGISRSRME